MLTHYLGYMYVIYRYRLVNEKGRKVEKKLQSYWYRSTTRIERVH